MFMKNNERFKSAIAAFDLYNSNDPHRENFNGQLISKELLYAQRMSEKLISYAPDAPEHIQLAARCQHIGRWEIPREQYPMDRKGYLKWRSVLKSLHATIAAQILSNYRYSDEEIEKVKFLLLKKELTQNADTQLLEDVICLVFIEHYLDEFAAKHTHEKVIDILRKTMKKMSPKAIEAVGHLTLSEKIKSLIQDAATDH
jgi:Domain of unknown function (DUF4202)